MSVLARPAVASFAARTMQRALALAGRRSSGPGSTASWLARLPEFPRDTRELTIPTSVAPAPAVAHLPDSPKGVLPPVHVNFHGGGYVMPGAEMDDALCRCLAAEAGVVVINVDYVVAPQHPFPAPTRQAYEVVRWVAEHGAEHGWDGDRLTVGGQSAGGGLAAAVARQALEEGGPSIALQVLHYPPLDLATNARDKRAAIARPMLRPWMADVFDSAYVPDPRRRSDRLVSPANTADTTDLTGIAPALVITAEYDLLRAEGRRYAERLAKAGALAEHHDVPKVDHGYDLQDAEAARPVYALIADHVRRAVQE
ncbi:alpha/beta hydrolase fold domain-containing protein [Streptomyces spongiae]|uniref:Alpha/beta hydrolase n=1 Tax=Streptomyces spongiae TaxID=565072 RepID=A0A5N8XPC1_9ACTN|nr:alpha/beta hydrolase fold domain-containing protein [Streptomyces spongiae]MPY61177.1 alpha/beta hydrolase [Streptomyces spongiae]